MSHVTQRRVVSTKERTAGSSPVWFTKQRGIRAEVQGLLSKRPLLIFTGTEACGSRCGLEPCSLGSTPRSLTKSREGAVERRPAKLRSDKTLDVPAGTEEKP